MPLYDYDCEVCGHLFEEITKGQDMVPCPVCGEPAVRQSAPADTHFGLKGSCWSKDGYRRRAPNKVVDKQYSIFK